MAQQELKSDPHQTRKELQQKFKKYDLFAYRTFDQLLFILDQQCQSYKCDRDVARQLYDQSVTPDGRANLSQIIFRYVQNVKTSALCIIRQKNGESILQEKLRSLKGSKKSYVYLKLIQATIHARHSSNPVFTYKIQPSDIPAVTVVNSLNPILNHQFTLQLQDNQFTIIFYESGVEIEKWNWPDSKQSQSQGQYHRVIMTEAISFELKINYKPIGSHPDRKKLQLNIDQVKKRINVENQAFQKLKSFQPFLLRRKQKQLAQPVGDHGAAWHFIKSLFTCLPFLQRHLRNLYFLLIILISVQCWASIYWPMQFLDITLGFGFIGLLYDRLHVDLGMPMLVCIFSFLVLIVKSLWGVVVKNTQNTNLIIPLIIGIVIKGICMFLAWIVFVYNQEVPVQRQYSFYYKIDPRTQKQIINQQQYFKNQQKFDMYS